MAKKRDLVRELLDRHCLITPESYEILEDLDADVVDIDKLAEALKDEIVVSPEKLREALASFEELLSEGSLEVEESSELVERKPETKISSPEPEIVAVKEEIKLISLLSLGNTPVLIQVPFQFLLQSNKKNYY